MKRTTLFFLLWFAFTAPAWAVPITLEFSVSKEGGSALGTFSYDTTALQVLTNLGGLQNAVYSPTNWNFQLLSTFMGDAVFSSSLAGHTAEWCVGICTFSSGQQVRLNLRNGAGLLFHFSFALTESVSTPPLFNQIGTFNQAVYRVENSVPVSVFFTGGALREVNPSPVPEPATWLYLAIGLGVMPYGFWAGRRKLQAFP